MEDEVKQRKGRKKDYQVIAERLTQLPERFHSAVPLDIRKSVKSKVKCFKDKDKREGHFSRLRLVTLIDPTLTESQKVLFSVFESLAFRFEIVNPSYEYLADILSVTPKTIQRNTKKLVELGFLYLIKRHNKSNIFLVAGVDLVYKNFTRLGVGKPSKLKWVQIQNFMNVLTKYFKDRVRQNERKDKAQNGDEYAHFEGTQKSTNREGGMVERKYIEELEKEVVRPFPLPENDEPSMDEIRDFFFQNLAESLDETLSVNPNGGSHASL